MRPNRHRRRPRLDERVYGGRGTAVSITVCCQDRVPVLADRPHAADTVVDTLRGLHGDDWRVLGYCVMPDHFHVLVLTRGRSIIEFVRLLKGRTATQLRRDSGIVGLWQTSFHDHLLRREEDILAVMRYIFENPVRKGLVKEWPRYPWCGSLEWSDIDSEFFARTGSDVVWREALRGGG